MSMPTNAALFRRSLSAIREFTEQHKDLFPKQGAMRMTFNPECPEADSWLGGESDFSDPNNPDIMSTSRDGTIVPGGEVTSDERAIEGDRKNPKWVTVDHSFVAEGMIACCCNAAAEGCQPVSGLTVHDINIRPKLSNSYGAYAVEVSLNGRAWCTVYVAVSIIWQWWSGCGESKRNLLAAYQAAPIIEAFFAEAGFTVTYPREEIERIIEEYVTA